MLRRTLRWSLLLTMTLCLACSSPSTTVADTTLFVHGGHAYEIVKTARTWPAAAADAASRSKGGFSGYLARIDNTAENTAIFDHLMAAIPSSEYTSTRAPDGGGGAYAWIGATDRVAEGTWIWDGTNSGSGDQFWSGTKTGSPVGGLYSNWGTVGGTQNEPDDYSGQDAAGISLNGWPTSDQHLGSASQWNDVDDLTNQLYYVVEYNAVPEPATASLLLVGNLLAAAWWPARRRR